MTRFLQALIRLYQAASRFWPKTCRFYPTCSTYMHQSLEQHGVARGLWLGLLRLLRCHPLNRGGVDPVPVPSHHICCSSHLIHPVSTH